MQKITEQTLRDAIHLPLGQTWTLFESAFPEIKRFAQTPQEPDYHAEGDVLIHTKMVVEALRAELEWQSLSADKQFVTFYGALLHDLGKPATTKPVDGRISSPGHSHRGAQEARYDLWRTGVQPALREQICQIVARHQWPFYLMERPADVVEFSLVKASQEVNLADLMLVAKADNLGRNTEPAILRQQTLDNIALAAEAAKEAECYEQSASMANSYTQWRYLQSKGQVPRQWPIHQPEETFEVVVLCGLPGSGKNSLQAQRWPEAPCVSYDDMRDELGVVHGENEGAVIHAAFDRARELLRKKTFFVWNATHLNPELRQKTLGLIHDYGGHTHLVHVETSYEESLRRNKTRERSLPDAALQRMFWKWEPPMQTEAWKVEHVLSLPLKPGAKLMKK